MPRSSRHDTIIPGSPHHIVLRGNNRRKLFSYAFDFRVFILLVARAQRRTGILFHGCCLMPNHVHMLVTPLDALQASRFVKSFAQRYAQLRNERRGGSGKLFEQRFDAFPIQDEHHLAAATTYIDLNPVRAGIVVAPGDYPWSTYRLHAGSARPCELARVVWTPSEWYRRLSSTDAGRASAYVDLVRQMEIVRTSEAPIIEPANDVRAPCRRPNGSRASG